MLKEKIAIWKDLKSGHNIVSNADFTKTINDNYKINIYINKVKDDITILRLCLLQDNVIIYNVEGVPSDSVFETMDALEDIVYSLRSKIITKADEELLASNGEIDCDYEWFMEHASYVTNNHFYANYVNEKESD
jgi:hypothetical protein